HCRATTLEVWLCECGYVMGFLLAKQLGRIMLAIATCRRRCYLLHEQLNVGLSFFMGCGLMLQLEDGRRLDVVQLVGLR
ncbi:hypothetical protein Dimus_035313, partial [Dionaea muscipula]